MSDPEGDAASGMRSLFGTGSVYTIAKGIQLAAAFLLLPFLTRWLSPAEYGIVTTALVVGQVMNGLATAGMPVAVPLQYFDGPDGPSEARTLLPWTILLAAAIVLAIDLLGPIWSSLVFSTGYATAIRIAVWAALPMATLSAVQALLQSSGRAAHYAAITIAGTVGAQAVGLAAVLFLGATADNYLMGVIAGSALAAAMAVVSIRLPVFRLRRRHLLFIALRRGIPSIPHDIGQYLIFAGDRVVLGHISGLAAVARYQVSYAVGTLGMAFVSAFAGAWAPLILGAPEESRWDLLARTTATLYRISALFAGALSLSAPLVLAILAPASYRPYDLARVTAIVSIAILPYVWLYANVLIVLQARRPGVLGCATPVSAIANVFLNLALVPWLGITGSAIATVITFTLEAIILKVWVRSMAPVPWRTRNAATSWLLGISLATAGGLCPTSPLWLVGRGCATLAIAGAVLVTVRDAMRSGLKPAVAEVDREGRRARRRAAKESLAAQLRRRGREPMNTGSNAIDGRDERHGEPDGPP